MMSAEDHQELAERRDRSVDDSERAYPYKEYEKLSVENHSISDLLRVTHEHLERDHAQASVAISNLAAGLRACKRTISEESWNSIIDACREHPLRSLLHQDPLTERAFTKPRGYQGDAQLLDVIYRKNYQDIVSGNVTSLGRSIFEYTIECKAPSAVRYRGKLLAKFIDEICELKHQPDILSVACGHLREAGLSEALKQGGVGRLVGLDQDVHSLDVIRREYPNLKVQTINDSITALSSGSVASEKFDFIYSAGLFDYLRNRFANALTLRMFEMLKPEGCLLIANYLPDIEDVGYMEAYMDWRLIYRTEQEMLALASNIPRDDIFESQTFQDPTGNIVFLKITKN